MRVDTSRNQHGNLHLRPSNCQVKISQNLPNSATTNLANSSYTFTEIHYLNLIIPEVSSNNISRYLIFTSNKRLTSSCLYSDLGCLYSRTDTSPQKPGANMSAEALADIRKILIKHKISAKLTMWFLEGKATTKIVLQDSTGLPSQLPVALSAKKSKSPSKKRRDARRRAAHAAKLGARDEETAASQPSSRRIVTARRSNPIVEGGAAWGAREGRRGSGVGVGASPIPQIDGGGEEGGGSAVENESAAEGEDVENESTAEEEEIVENESAVEEEDDDDGEESDDACCHQMVPDVPDEPPYNECWTCRQRMAPWEAIQACKLCGYDECSECIKEENYL